MLQMVHHQLLAGHVYGTIYLNFEVYSMAYYIQDTSSVLQNFTVHHGSDRGTR